MSYIRMDQLNKMFGMEWKPCMRARLKPKRRERQQPMWLWRLRFNRKDETL